MLILGIFLILNSLVQFISSFNSINVEGKLALSFIFFTIGLLTTMFSIFEIQDRKKRIL